MSAEITPALASLIERSDPLEWLDDIVIELDGGTEDVSDVAAAKEEFSRVALPVIKGIEFLGGDVMNRAWIDHTIRAHVLAGDVAAIAQIDGVRAIDLAQMIGSDAVHEPGDGLLAGIGSMDPDTAASMAHMVRQWRNMPREEFQEFARGL